MSNARLDTPTSSQVEMRPKSGSKRKTRRCKDDSNTTPDNENKDQRMRRPGSSLTANGSQAICKSRSRLPSLVQRLGSFLGLDKKCRRCRRRDSLQDIRAKVSKGEAAYVPRREHPLLEFDTFVMTDCDSQYNEAVPTMINVTRTPEANVKSSTAA